MPLAEFYTSHDYKPQEHIMATSCKAVGSRTFKKWGQPSDVCMLFITFVKRWHGFSQFCLFSLKDPPFLTETCRNRCSFSAQLKRRRHPSVSGEVRTCWLAGIGWVRSLIGNWIFAAKPRQLAISAQNLPRAVAAAYSSLFFTRQ